MVEKPRTRVRLFTFRNPDRPFQPRMSDRRLAVMLLGVVGVIAVISDFVLLLNGNEPPGGLLAVAGGCVGALATLVTAAQPPRTHPFDPALEEPVPVDSAPAARRPPAPPLARSVKRLGPAPAVKPPPAGPPESEPEPPPHT